MQPRILIVDDNRIIRETLKTMFQDGGFEVCGEADDGQRAAELAEKLKPDTIIMDLAMPVLNGLASSREISQILPGVPIVLHTLHAYAELDLEAKKNGICRVVPKSEGHRIVSIVRELLATRVMEVAPSAVPLAKSKEQIAEIPKSKIGKNGGLPEAS